MSPSTPRSWHRLRRSPRFHPIILSLTVLACSGSLEPVNPRIARIVLADTIGIGFPDAVDVVLESGGFLDDKEFIRLRITAGDRESSILATRALCPEGDRFLFMCSWFSVGLKLDRRIGEIADDLKDLGALNIPFSEFQERFFLIQVPGRDPADVVRFLEALDAVQVAGRTPARGLPGEPIPDGNRSIFTIMTEDQSIPFSGIVASPGDRVTIEYTQPRTGEVISATTVVF